MPLYDPTIWDNKATKRLVAAILACRTPAQTKAVLGDLLTDKEIKELSQRLAIADSLRRGLAYTSISQQLGVSSATIAEVSRWYRQGGGGYDLVLRLLDEIAASEALPTS